VFANTKRSDVPRVSRHLGSQVWAKGLGPGEVIAAADRLPRECASHKAGRRYFLSFALPMVPAPGFWIPDCTACASAKCCSMIGNVAATTA